MRNLMSEIFQFSSILTLTSTHHVTLTMDNLNNIFFLCQLSIKQITELKIIKIDPRILEILFSLDLLQILLITDTNYTLIRC